MSQTAYNKGPGFNSSIFTGGTTEDMNARSNFFGHKKASADCAFLRATASTYLVPEMSPAAKQKFDKHSKPSIKVTDLK